MDRSQLEPLRPRPAGARRFRNDPRLETASLPPVQHGFIKSFDGTQLFYSVEGSGPPLVFCYGLVCSSLHWTYQIDYFRRNFQTIWFDYRGHQNSEVPKDLGSLTIETIARDLLVLLDELRIPPAVMLGHSMGVNVVLEAYRLRPERFRGMVLAHGTAKRPLETMFRNNFMEKLFEGLRSLYGVSPELIKKIWALQKKNPLARMMIALEGFNPHLTAPEDIDLYIDQVLDMDPSILLNLVHHYNAYDATAWIHTIQTPTLLIGGEQDKVIPSSEQKLMHQLIPDSELSIVRRGSHCSQMDLPELCNLRIEGFLRKIGYFSESSSAAIDQSIDGNLQSTQ